MTREQQIAAVLTAMEEGTSERAACEAAGIARSTFRTTALRHISGDQYARALKGLALDQTEKMEIALQEMRDGSLDVNQARLEIDTRKWFASKFLPKQFGDKLAVGGAEDLPAIQTQDINLSVAKLMRHGMTEEAALRLIASEDDK